MLLIALKMLIADRARFLGILMGLTFATFIITQQAGIFAGLMKRTFGFITDTAQADIWVMDPKVQYIEDVKPMSSSALFRVRSIAQVAWASPLFKGALKTRMRDGNFQVCNVIGIDAATLIGGPPIMLEGNITDLRLVDGVIINDVGVQGRMASDDGKRPMQVGDVLQINDRRAKVVGICKVGRTFRSEPVIYTTFNRALNYAPIERKMLSFILVKAEENILPTELAKIIREKTNLAAYTAEEFKKLTVMFYIKNTGILINFGFAVVLGFIIGVVISGQTFYNFALENLRYFGLFKAMGASRDTLTKMVGLQALFVGVLGFGLGMGFTTLFSLATKNTELSFFFPWPLFLASLLSILLIVLFSAYLSIKRIVNVDPVMVFQK